MPETRHWSGRRLGWGCVPSSTEISQCASYSSLAPLCTHVTVLASASFQFVPSSQADASGVFLPLLRLRRRLEYESLFCRRTPSVSLSLRKIALTFSRRSFVASSFFIQSTFQVQAGTHFHVLLHSFVAGPRPSVFVFFFLGRLPSRRSRFLSRQMRRVSSLIRAGVDAASRPDEVFFPSVAILSSSLLCTRFSHPENEFFQPFFSLNLW